MNIFKSIFNYIFLFISILVFFYTIYKSEIIWDGTRREYYLAYYLFSLCLIFFSIIFFFLSKKLKKILFIFFNSLIISIFSIELYLIYKQNNYKFEELERVKIKAELFNNLYTEKYDIRTKSEIFDHLKKNDNNVSVTTHISDYLNYNNLDFLPLGSKSFSKTILCNENGYYAIYDSDRYGFNNPDGEWDQKEIEYLVVGDSFPHGACVNRPDDLASFLRKYSNKHVINLGFSDLGPLSEFATIKEYFPNNVKVKNIIWFFSEGNDIYDLESELQIPYLANYLKSKNFSQNLKSKQNLIDDLVLKITNDQLLKKKSSNLVGIHGSVNDEIPFFNKILNFIKLNKIRNFYLPKPQKELTEIFRQTQEFAKKNNSKLHIVYMPAYQRYKGLSYSNIKNQIKDISKELNINLIDIDEEIFSKEKDPFKLFPFKMYGHYTVDAYDKISKKIDSLVSE
jgi:hypothetical protein